jgi:hypothetical protein
MSPQTAQAFLDGLPRMQAVLRASRRILGPVAYARHMHELDTEELVRIRFPPPGSHLRT